MQGGSNKTKLIMKGRKKLKKNLLHFCLNEWGYKFEYIFSSEDFLIFCFFANWKEKIDYSSAETLTGWISLGTLHKKNHMAGRQNLFFKER